MRIPCTLSCFQVTFMFSTVLVGCFVYSMVSWTSSDYFPSAKAWHARLGTVNRSGNYGRPNSEANKSDIVDGHVSNQGAPPHAHITDGNATISELPESTGGGVKVNEGNSRYLLHVHYDLNGPNVQHFAFKAGVAYAKYSNRTIVEPLFFTHWTQEHSYRRLRTFNETYDAKELAKIVRVSTFAEFHDSCNSSIDVLLIPPEKVLSSAEYENKRSIYSNAFNISLPPFSEIANTRSERIRALRASDSVKCLGIYEPSSSIWTSWPVVPDTSDVLNLVERHLIRAPGIRRVAKSTANKMCGGRPYLALHWRNRTGEICKPGRPCQNTSLIAAINKTAAVAADDLKKFMTKTNLTCTYVAFPPYAKSMIDILNDAKVPNVVTREDITGPEFPEVERFKGDNYMLALIEQEICIGSSIFIATLFSSWSGVVKSARKVIGAPTETLPDFITWRDERVALRR